MIKLTLMQREKAAILFYRRTLRLSINHIAKLLCRSSRSVWKTLKKTYGYASKKYDLRHFPRIVKIRGETAFRAKKNLLEWCLYAFLTGLRDDIEVLLGDEPP